MSQIYYLVTGGAKSVRGGGGMKLLIGDFLGVEDFLVNFFVSGKTLARIFFRGFLGEV